ncbi:MAG: hypothetical protein MAG451_00162 [Anaerolineales bacterium]|nr:hypothetical protein [Anaerolineales bacterium]
MKILAVVQGEYGRRIAANIDEHKPAGWTINTWRAPAVLPPIVDYPEDYLPEELPAADLILSLGEDPGVAELLPDIVQMTGADAVLAPVDNVAWLPPGLMKQLARWLDDVGASAAFPKPFCSLTETTYNEKRHKTEYDIPLIAEFAAHFGRPEFRVEYDEDGSAVTKVEVVRDAACGCARHVAEHLAGAPADEAEHEAGMLHHHYPCLASMGIDPDYSDTLMHVSGNVLKDAVADQIKPHKTPPKYFRPSGRSGDEEVSDG